MAVGRECGGDGTSLTRRETDLVAQVDGVGGGVHGLASGREIAAHAYPGTTTTWA